MICPDCKAEISDDSKSCNNCGFDLVLYSEVFEGLYAKKLEDLRKNDYEKQTVVVYQPEGNHKVHKPRCPYCNSENLSRITNLERATNAALFGILGNKRKYQWTCNNCRTSW